MEIVFQHLFIQLRQHTKASESQCRNVAARITDEVVRICNESPRIQASGEIENWGKTLANHRFKQCLRYYKLGSARGRVELQSLLSAMVYRYISPMHGSNTYQGRVILIEDFLQGFYVEALNNFRKEAKLPLTYSPRSLLELAEYMAFCERYAKRRISLPGRRSQQLIILRAQTFSKKQPPETSVDMDRAAEGTPSESEDRGDPIVQQLRALLASNNNNPTDTTLRDTIIEEVIQYLESRKQSDCADYFILRLQDLSANEINAILGLTSRERDYLQQRFRYHLIRFALSHRWELVHQWLEADLERNLGLTAREWQSFQDRLTPQQSQLLQLKRQGLTIAEIADRIDLTPTRTEKQWYKLLELAWEIRNRSVS
ncbi:MAG: heterocyst differentiation protein HetZ [Cyanobacteria bacterium SBLK]|nr:heterocyst differentiation protein HetZ [Cyanobacteria bacterium SBLK]